MFTRRHVVYLVLVKPGFNMEEEIRISSSMVSTTHNINSTGLLKKVRICASINFFYDSKGKIRPIFVHGSEHFRCIGIFALSMRSIVLASNKLNYSSFYAVSEKIRITCKFVAFKSRKNSEFCVHILLNHAEMNAERAIGCSHCISGLGFPVQIAHVWP